MFFLLLFVDCFASQLCAYCFDLHHDCSTIWRVSKPDHLPMDVWSTVYLRQVKTPLTNRPIIKQSVFFEEVINFFSVLLHLSNEQPSHPKMKYFIQTLLKDPGMGTRCMVNQPLE